MFASCAEEPEVILRQAQESPEVDWTKENSTNLSKSLAIDEEINIKLFLEQHKKWKMTKTGSGLQYYIYEHGKIDTMYSPKPGDIAEIEYVVTLLDGTECYRTEENKYEEFKVDNSEIESGIQEGIKKLTIGDRAKLIIPSHLGHGLLGDSDKIPPLTTLVIDIRLIGIMI
jgi:FKBP-type peptidyl-prolyl cis-trans isomerase